MPKIKSSVFFKCERFSKQFGKLYFQTDGNVLICKVCDKIITAQRKSHVEQHVDSDGHQRKLKFFLNAKHQLFLSEYDVTQSIKTFYQDLPAFFSGDLPLCKISIPDFKSLIIRAI